MKKFTFELKPTKGSEKVVGKYTYNQFLEIIKEQAMLYGLEFKITRV